MTALLKYDAACAALAESLRVDEVMAIHDRWEAIRHCQRIAGNYALEADAAEVRERAERRLGELLVAAKAKGQVAPGQPKKNAADEEGYSRVKLADAGITHKLSSRSQRKAGIAQRAFEEMIARMRADIVSGRRTADVLKGSAALVQQNERRELERTLSDETARLATSGRKFSVIYADPATRFRAGIGNRSIENHYPTMTTEEICAMPVQARCLPDARLYIWTTVPQLANTIARILPAWEFEYSSCCVWDKTDAEHENEVGTGLVFRNQHELLIYAKRGHPAGPLFKPPSIYRERKREHSRKPDYYREMIDKMTGGLPALELFARVDDEHPLPPGWEAWGNQSDVADDGSPTDPDTGEIISDNPTLPAVNHQTLSGQDQPAVDELDCPAFLLRNDPQCTWRGK